MAERLPYASRALGIDLRVGFPCPALPPLPGARPASATLVELGAVAPDSLAGPPERSVDQRHRDGSPALTFETDGERHLLWADGYGRFLVGAGGMHVTCMPEGSGPDWWQRLLCAQVLPLAAVQRGLEVLHASAARIGDGAFALVGASGAGKSVLALECVAAGGELLADDALAISASGAGVMAHAGPPVSYLLDADLPLAESLAGAGIATRSGRSEKHHLRVDRRCEAAPLRALYFIGRSAPEPAIERIAAPTAGLILGATFNFYLRTPERLSRQLELLARVATEAAVFRLEVPPGADPRAVAAMLGDHFLTAGAVAVG